MTEKGTNQEMKSTVAKYYDSLISDFKTNEKKIMKELD
jgi:ribosomal protein S17E